MLFRKTVPSIDQEHIFSHAIEHKKALKDSFLGRGRLMEHDGILAFVRRPEAPVPYRLGYSTSLINVFVEYRGQCCFCGCQTHLPRHVRQEDPNMATREHVIPQCKGGGDGWDNVVLACLRCNQKKGARTDMKPSVPPRKKPDLSSGRLPFSELKYVFKEIGRTVKIETNGNS